MLVPVILSGGNGSRLWPISREAHPKPFIRLNDAKLSLLQKTYLRAINIPNIKKIITVTNADYYYQNKKELNELASAKKKEFSFLLEPASRNTTSAIALCALFVKKLLSPDTVLLIMPADHMINNQEKFNQCVKRAYSLTKQGLLITFGVIPDKVETAYGYMQYIKYTKIASKHTIYKVINFHEKPTPKEAKFFIEQGDYLWNSGIFCFTADALLTTLEAHSKTLYKKIINCWEISDKNTLFFHNKAEDNIKFDKESFLKLDNISIDYSLMEKAKNIATIPADFGWSDIGSWTVLDKLIKPDKNRNRMIGNAMLLDTYDTTIYNPIPSKRLVTAIGIKNLTIIDTDDALLICDHACVQQVKQLVDKLRASGHESCRYHQTVYRPWGSYTIVDQGPTYKLKRIVVHPGASLSLQAHQFRSEYWTVIEGIATVQKNKKQFTLKRAESIFIPLASKHRLSNLGLKDLILIEIQLGNYLGEDDIIRFKDIYGRKDEIPNKTTRHKSIKQKITN